MLGIFLDIEANGLDMGLHSPLSIAIKIIELSDGQLLSQFDSFIAISDEDWERSSKTSLKINGITKSQVEGAPTAGLVKTQIQALFKEKGITRNNAVYICQNPSFDRAFFHQIIPSLEQEKAHWPYHWLDLASMFWSKQMAKAPPFPWEFGISKNCIAKAYKLRVEALPHTAMGGVDHLIECYEAVVGFPEHSSKV